MRPQVITVVQARRYAINILTAPLDDLEAYPKAAHEDQALLRSEGALAAFKSVAETLREPFGVSGLGRPMSQTLTALLVRELAANPALYLILATGEGKASRVTVRMPKRARAIDSQGRETAVAAETPVDIIGLAIDENHVGATEHATETESVYALSGSYTGSKLAASAPAGLRPPECPWPGSEPRAKLALRRVLFDAGSDGNAEALRLLEHTWAAIDYNRSGAAVMASHARITAAILGLTWADPALKAAFAQENNSISSASITDAIVDTYELPEQLKWLNRKLTEAGLIYGDSEAWALRLGALCDLFRVGAFDLYLTVIVEGREAESVDEFLANSRSLRVRKQASRKIQTEADIDTARARAYMIIIEDLLGGKRRSEVLAGLQAMGSGMMGAPGGRLALASESVRIDSSAKVDSLLTDREREVVHLEWKNRVTQWMSTTRAAGACPHLAVVRRLVRATTVEQAGEALAAVDEMAEKLVTDGWIICRTCRAPLICPHARDLVLFKAHKATFDKIQAGLMRYSLDVQMGGDTYFCKICAGFLIEPDRDIRPDINPGRYGALGSQLRTKVWQVAIVASSHLRTPTPVDPKQFAAKAADVVSPLVAASYIESTAASKTRGKGTRGAGGAGGTGATEAETADLMPATLLSVIVYVYAFILDLVQSTPNTGFDSVPQGAKAEVCAGKILQLIAKEHRNILAQIEGITGEKLKEMFVAAYRAVRAHGGHVINLANPEEVLAIQLTTLDPVYQYARTVARVDGRLPSKNAATPGDARREFETIMGNTLPGIITAARVGTRDPSLRLLFNRTPGSEVATDSEFLMKDHRINLYSKMYSPKTKTTPASAPLQARLFHEAYVLQREFLVDLTSASAKEKYEEKLAKHRALDATYLAARKKNSIPPYCGVKGAVTTQRWVGSPSPRLSSLYDEEGRRHSWVKNATFVYRVAGKEDMLEIKGGIPGVKAARENGTLPFDCKLEDVICPTCGVLRSKTDELDEKKVTLSVMAAAEREAFFAFYEGRCPETDGGPHAFSAEDECTRCGYSTKNKDAFYSRYKDGFAQARRQLLSAGERAPPVSHPVTESKRPRILSWSPDYTWITRAAALVSATPATIEAIGSTEARNYDDVINGKDIPPPPESLDSRVYSADAAVRMFISDYSRLRHAYKVAPPETVAAALEVAPRHEFEKELNRLPLVGNSYREDFLSMAASKAPHEVLTFSIQSLCQFVIEVTEIKGPAWVMSVAATFAKAELESILRGQKLLCRPGAFDWGIFEDPDADNDIISADIGDVGEDVDEKNDKSLATFSEGRIDYDLSEDNPNNE